MPTTSPRAFTSGPPELPGLMAASVWMNCPGLRRIVRVRIGTVQRAHDAASHREAEAKGITKGQHGLSGMQRGRVANRNVGKVRAINLDYGQIGERIGADQLRRQDATIAERNLDIGGAIDHVVVGNDVAIGRNNDAAADAVLDSRLLRLHMLAELLAKEVLHVVGHAFGHGLGFHAGGHSDVDNRRRDAGSDGFHRLVKREQGANLVVVKRRSIGRNRSSHRCNEV